MKRSAAACLLAALPLAAALASDPQPAAAVTPAKTTHSTAVHSSRRPSASHPDLMWHVETLDGQEIDSHLADDPLNPASVVKVATSLWALERLGPDYRYETRFYAEGTIDPSRATLRGDLVVQGSGDPDFQPENAFLVADALNRRGIRRVTGRLVVDDHFWIGWEGGSAGTDTDPVRRGTKMALRLRQALDPNRWNGEVRAAWREFALRRGLPRNHPYRVEVVGGVRFDDAVPAGEPLLVHRGNPLVDVLRRFNVYSNNDIERVGNALGKPDDLAGLLEQRLNAAPGEVRLETTSGLGTNRLTPRIVVHLLREFRRTSEHLGLEVEDVLPVAGCDPGTVSHFFPELAGGENATSLVGKTGTLTTTDGGVSLLAGFINTAQGERVFCVAAPRSGGYLRLARRWEERWVLDLLSRNGGPQARGCTQPLASPDGQANVILGGR